MIMSFSKIVGKTASKGQITVPKECDNILDKYQYCPISDSVAITYRLQNGAEIPGRLYQSANNTTTYYQFYIPDAKDKIIFENQIGCHRAISIDFNIKTHCLRVSPLEIE